MLLLLGIPLLAIMAGLTAYGFSQLQHGQSHGFLNWLEGVAEAGIFFIAPIAEEALKLTSWLTHMLGKYFEGTFVRLVHFVAAVNTYLQVTAKVALTWPIELFRLHQWLIWHKIPELIGLRTRPLAKQIAQTDATSQAALKAASGLAKSHPGVVTGKAVVRIERVAMPHAGEWSWINRHWKGLTKAIALATAGALSLPHTITHDVTIPFGSTAKQILRKLRRLNWIAAYAGAAALVTAALVKMGLGWIRCSNVAKAGKAICKVNTRWLENLLLGLTAIFGTISLRVFAKDVYDLMHDAVSQVNHFWRNDLKGTAPNPGLGETGGPAFLNTSKSYAAPNPGLGEVG